VTLNKETTTVPSRATETHVAELLPATAPAPQPVRRVNFFKALLLFWLLPKRFGPHLAVASWWRALAAHGIAAVCFLLVVAYLTFDPVTPGSPGLHELRVAAARLVLDLASTSAMFGFSRSYALLVLGVVPVLELACVILAVVVMPWCAGGDRASSVFKRSLKNVYWSTTFLIPIAVVSLMLNAFESDLEELAQTSADILVIAGPVIGTAIAFVLYVRILVVGASVYVGEPVGPAFAPREPLCDECGYRMTGLPLEGNCPECGTPVRASLPGGRRRRNAWHLCEFRPRGLLELVRLQGRVLRGNEFFRQLPVQEGLATARHFWWGTFLLILLVILVLTRLATDILLLCHPHFEFRVMHYFEESIMAFRGLTAMFVVPVLFLLQSVFMFAGCLYAQRWLGMRDYRTSAVVCYYAAPLMWPVILVAWAGSFVWMCGEAGVLPAAGHFRTIVLGISLTGPALAALAWMVLTGIALAFWWLRLWRALRAVRYANV